MYLFLIYFQVRTSNWKCHTGLFLTHKSKDLCERVRDDSAHLSIGWNTKHGMSFTAPCLTIRENSSVVSLDDRFHEWSSSFSVHSLLLRIYIINWIVSKVVLNLSVSARLHNGYLFVGFVHCENGLASSRDLRFVHWTHTNHYLDSFSWRSFLHISLSLALNIWIWIYNSDQLFPYKLHYNIIVESHISGVLGTRLRRF